MNTHFSCFDIETRRKNENVNIARLLAVLYISVHPRHSLFDSNGLTIFEIITNLIVILNVANILISAYYISILGKLHALPTIFPAPKRFETQCSTGWIPYPFVYNWNCSQNHSPSSANPVNHRSQISTNNTDDTNSIRTAVKLSKATASLHDLGIVLGKQKVRIENIQHRLDQESSQLTPLRTEPVTSINHINQNYIPQKMQKKKVISWNDLWKCRPFSQIVDDFHSLQQFAFHRIWP